MTLKRFINYYFPPFVFPFIPKISIDQEGFFINKRRILFQDIISIHYANSYPSTSSVAPVIGSSGFEILTTTDDKIVFFGEHDELRKIFDEKFEKLTEVYDKLFGEVERWKRPGQEYVFVSLDDSSSYSTTEKLSKITVSPHLAKWVIVGGVLIILLIFIVTIVGALLPLIEEWWWTKQF